MELKLELCYHEPLLVRPFNRTIVELKPQRDCRIDQPNRAFNRTIVELKLIKENPEHNPYYQLLIEPLWNWNANIRVPAVKVIPAFNRTIVELKLSQQVVHTDATSAFNRTIVELKLGQGIPYPTKQDCF